MLPIAIVRFASHEGPGYLAQILEEQHRPWRLVAVDQGEAVPADPSAFAGLVLMGGPMRANDPLPWIPQVLDLVRRAVDHGVPVLGHCLGAQLLARALGASVTANAVAEIGWHPVQVRPGGEAWFGDARSFLAFHWHGETFAIPEGARWIAQSVACAHQAFAMGPHLGVQFHVEMTASMVEAWAYLGREEILQCFGPWVQEPLAMMAATPQWIDALQAVARRVYAHWLAGVDGRRFD